MHRGCISLGEIQCDGCHHLIPSSERYLAIDGEDNAEAGKIKTTRYCIKCALERGYASSKSEGKGEKILTFFVEPPLGEPGEKK